MEWGWGGGGGKGHPVFPVPFNGKMGVWRGEGVQLLVTVETSEKLCSNSVRHHFAQFFVEQ